MNIDLGSERHATPLEENGTHSYQYVTQLYGQGQYLQIEAVRSSIIIRLHRAEPFLGS
jgi:hypothetical protein